MLSDEYKVVSLLTQKNKRITFAESLTGGMLSQTIVSVPGASKVFEYGFVTYSNEAKIKLLGLEPELIEIHGAVSKQCAMAMAKGAWKNSSADIAVSVTGFAGPKGEDDNEPVGTVYMGVCICGKTDYRKFSFDGDRQEIRVKTTHAVFNYLVDVI